MRVARSRLTVLLNALYDTGATTISVAHPSPDLGELLSIELEDAAASTVRFSLDTDAFAEIRNAIEMEYGSGVSDELPRPASYRNGLLAGGLLDIPNREEVSGFLERNGYPDLTAGHHPVVAGFDTNLLPWRIAEVLELEPGHDGSINGFALATGVRDELDWEHKRGDTRTLEAAFGPTFDALWNQPSGSRREGRLGQTNYRRLRDQRYAEEIITDKGDVSIVEGYDTYQQERGKDVLLFSHDRDFVERARSHRVRAQRVELPASIPDRTTASWETIGRTLYVLAVLFGVLELPKVTLYGVWKGKEAHAWQDEKLKLECRSPKVGTLVERDLEILGVS